MQITIDNLEIILVKTFAKLVNSAFRKKAVILLIQIVVFLGLTVSGQQQPLHPVSSSKPAFFMKTEPLRQLPLIKPQASTQNEENGEVENLEWHGMDSWESDPDFEDPALQKAGHAQTRSEINRNFEGVDNLQNVLPPDTEGDVGKDHYIQMVNMSFAIFDKEGNTLYGPASNLSLWQHAPEPWASFSNGDPIVLYDEQADRWLVSELSFPNHPYNPHYIKLAISETSDPLGSWYLYGYEYEYFCDYPKISVWNNGYYLTTNNNFWVNNQWDFHAVGLSVFERDSLLTGSPDARRFFYDFYPNQQPWSMLPSDFDGPVPDAGTPAYLAYLDEGATDRIFIYQVHTDWQNINNSTVQRQATLLPEAFSDNLPEGIDQPDEAPYLAPMANRLMYRLQFRQFDGYNVLVANHTVNRGEFIAGIRWYEFRDSGSGWEIHQQGTFSPDDTHRWMGSVAMDGYGNIAAGYSASSRGIYPSVRIAGRTADAAPGIFDVAEQTIIAGSGAQTNQNHRWGDYSAMTVDPSDQTTFWYTQQYYETTGNRSWQTRIAAFHINDYLEMNVITYDDTVCLGNTTQLLSMVAGGSEQYTFTWQSDPPGYASSEQNPVVSPDENTTYICNVNDGVNQITDSVFIAVTPAPIAFAGPDSIICNNWQFEIHEAFAANNEGISWATSGDGTFSDVNVINPVYTPGTDDISNGFTDLILNAQPQPGCTMATDSLTLFIDPCTGIQNFSGSGYDFAVYPNPGNGKLTITSDRSLSEKVTFEVFSLNGMRLQQGNLGYLRKPASRKLEISSLGRGIYLLHLKSGLHEKTVKLVIGF